MICSATVTAVKAMKDRTDEELVQECLKGNQDAWVAVIHRYRHLVFSVIRSYHLSDSDAADVFQFVCLELFNNLSRLRDVGGLRRWLITVAGHQCFRVKTANRGTGPDEEPVDWETIPDTSSSSRLAEVERAQMLHKAMHELPRRCREMVRLLFLEDPPLPYSDLAGRLGLAVGSIGFIRRRCLDKLKTALERMGF